MLNEKLLEEENYRLEGDCLVKTAAEQKSSINFYKAVFIYMLGGIVGTVWETILNLCCGDGFVFCNGSIFTPFNFVYGVGAVVIILCLHNRTDWREVYIIGAFGGGAVEYALSFLEETILGTRSWNYSEKLLNINGRTTLLYMAVWGALCTVVIFAVYRPLNRLLDKMPEKVMRTVAIVMTVVLILDLAVTVAVLFRYAARNSGKAALTAVGELIDRLCGDEFMKLRFPAMKFAQK